MIGEIYIRSFPTIILRTARERVNLKQKGKATEEGGRQTSNKVCYNLETGSVIFDVSFFFYNLAMEINLCPNCSFHYAGCFGGNTPPL